MGDTAAAAGLSPIAAVAGAEGAAARAAAGAGALTEVSLPLAVSAVTAFAACSADLAVVLLL
jgi:hypothetical protein